MKSNHCPGFTLLELMLVLAIISLLAGLVFPNIMREKIIADQKIAIVNIAALESALKRYKLDYGVYPTTDQGLEELTFRSPGKGGYIDRLPRDPWGRNYLYLNPGDNLDIEVFTYGADGQEGGEDENTDIGSWNIQNF